jgi:SAM-dependent methyltransferase
MPRVTDTDEAWEHFGQTDPYFAVLTSPEFHGQLSGPERTKFFRSGEAHIQEMFTIIRQRLDPSFNPSRALDFGCGVGRLLLPLAARCREVTGVDVSPSMLSEARRNTDAVGATNVRLVKTDDRLSTVEGPFDFVHSYIVLQHIPVERGESIVRTLASKLAANGVGMFHATYTSGRRGVLAHTAYWARLRLPGARRFLNIARGRAINAPIMQMNSYSITRLLDILSREGCTEVHVRFSDHGGARGVLLFARKSGAPIFA